MTQLMTHGFVRLTINTGLYCFPRQIACTASGLSGFEDNDDRQCYVVLQDGDLQLFSVDEPGILDNLPPAEDDTISVMASFSEEPYILLGCDSGDLRLVALLGADRKLARAPVRIKQMELHSYRGDCLVGALLTDMPLWLMNPLSPRWL